MLTARSLAIVLGIFLLGLQYKLWIASDGFAETIQLRHQIAKEQQVDHEYDQYNQQLVARITQLKSGDKAVEGLARGQLGMIKPGETYYQFI